MRIACALMAFVLVEGAVAAPIRTIDRKQAEKAYSSVVTSFSQIWQRAQKEGRPAAERLVAQAPVHFKRLKSQAVALQKVCQENLQVKSLEEKKNLLVELWRVRQGLDIISLLEPETIYQLTGINLTGVNDLRSSLRQCIATVTSALRTASKSK